MKDRCILGQCTKKRIANILHLIEHLIFRMHSDFNANLVRHHCDWWRSWINFERMYLPYLDPYFPPMKAGKIGRQTLPYLQVCVICFRICLTFLFPKKSCIFISLLLCIIEQNLLKQIQLEKNRGFCNSDQFSRQL